MGLVEKETGYVCTLFGICLRNSTGVETNIHSGCVFRFVWNVCSFAVLGNLGLSFRVPENHGSSSNNYASNKRSGYFFNCVCDFDFGNHHCVAYIVRRSSNVFHHWKYSEYDIVGYVGSD